MNLNDDPKGGIFCLSKAGLAIGSGDVKDLDIAAPNGAGVDFVIDGKLYHKADAADIAVVVTDEDGSVVSTQAADTTCLYLVQLDVSGNLTTIKGEEVDTDELTAGSATLKYPVQTEDTCPIGAVKIVTDGVTFLCGTDNFSKSDVADTYYGLFTLPPHPMV